MENIEADAKLRVAVQQGNVERVEKVLKLDGVDPNTKLDPRSLTSHTALTQAVELDRPDIVRLLLDHPDTLPDAKGNDGFTPLTLAIAKSSPDLVSVLLSDPRIDVNMKEGGGLTPLHMAVSCRNKDIVEMLVKDSRLEKDVKVEGLTALEFAQTMDDIDNDLVNLLSS
eukprot:GFUD01028384.1.p1 GENE.GFUD01028384.1~~GFUD01028384.1.p1  ORF type:complete len:190 (-),score=78.13 GFUD01028384.1:76-582(-)